MSVWLPFACMLMILRTSTPGTPVPPVNYFSPENIMRFAEHLYEDEDYLRAAGEYQRYLFLSDQRTDTVLYKIGLCYQSAGEFQKAIRFFGMLIQEFPSSDLTFSAHQQVGYSYFLMDENDYSVKYLKRTLTKPANECERWNLRLILGFNYLIQKRWTKSTCLFDSLASSTQDQKRKTLSLKLKNYAEEGVHQHFKNPLLAGTFSAFIPGAGKIYCSRRREGLFSLLLIGTAAYFAHDALRKESSVRSWFYGGLTCFFYLGNIYGSYVAARIHNRNLEDDLIARIQFEIHLYHE